MDHDWDNEAAVMAEYVNTHMFPAHRGAMPWKQEGVSVAFGNDGYDGEDGRSQNEVAMVREYLEENGIPVLGFGVDAKVGYSWAMLVKTRDHEMLHKLVWASWMPKTPVRDVMAAPGEWRGMQPEIAAKEIGESSPAPRVELN